MFFVLAVNHLYNQNKKEQIETLKLAHNNKQAQAAIVHSC